MNKTALLVVLLGFHPLRSFAAEPPDYKPLDPPLRTVTVAVPQPRDPNGPGSLHCFHYPAFTVKQLDLNEVGSRAISVTPVVPGRALPPCGKQDDPGEVVLKEGQGSYFAGALGPFVQTFFADGHDGTPFRIYDGGTGRLLYSDVGAGLHLDGASLAGEVLSITYTRAVPAPCSILAGGAACWARTVREARLPSSVAAQGAPVASCRETYAKGAGGLPGPIEASDPSYLRYTVAMTLERSGKATVLSRGAVTCWPQS